MRIAIWHNLPSGGGKRALYYHIIGLVERGHTVEIWFPPTADLSYLPLGSLCPEHIVPYKPRFFKYRTFNNINRWLGFYPGTIHSMSVMQEHCRLCGEEINEKGFDILLANSCRIFAASAIGRFVTIPKVLYLQEPNRELYETRPELSLTALSKNSSSSARRGLRPFIQNWFTINRKRVQVRYELENAKAFDRILVNSYFSRESILRSYGLDSRVCYLGIDNNLFKNMDIRKKNYIIGIGSLTRAKNIEFILTALGLLHEPRPKLVWVGNVGDKKYITELKCLATELGVIFEPKILVTDRQIVEILNQARMMAYAPRLEPFGFAPLEANACGIPVVAVAEGGVRETIQHNKNGLLVDSNPVEMAQAIQTLLDSPELAHRLGKQGEAHIKENWTWGAAIDRLEMHLLNIISGNKN